MKSLLTVLHGTKRTVLEFTPPCGLSGLLADHGFVLQHPCGGRGICGKCAVEISGAFSLPDGTGQFSGKLPACRITLLGNAEVLLPDTSDYTQIELSGVSSLKGLHPRGKQLGAAVDIGTTTVAVKVYELASGREVGSAAALNPQTAEAADVMGRIQAALDGKLEKLRDEVRSAVSRLISDACTAGGRTPEEIDSAVITGNTTMLYLYTGRSPASLARAPFQADCLFDKEERPERGIAFYFPPCISAFVGADISCAVLASGMCENNSVSLLCDIGTNGEIALWKDGVLYVTSTAAGPAFEGAGISCGSGSVPGAIDKVSAVPETGSLSVHTIEDAPAVGICGSGLLDATAAFLDLEIIDETGAVEDPEDLALCRGVHLLPQDIRAVQLAKAAIAAGIQTLTEQAGISYSQIETLYIAGGFGSHLNVRSAVRIGLIPADLADRTEIIGNAALSGASQLLLDKEQTDLIRKLAAASSHVSLGGNPKFNTNYMEQILFPFDDE